MQNEALQAELEKAVADNPDLLRMNGVVAWFIARATITAEEVFNVLTTVSKTPSMLTMN